MQQAVEPSGGYPVSQTSHTAEDISTPLRFDKKKTLLVFFTFSTASLKVVEI